MRRWIMIVLVSTGCSVGGGGSDEPLDLDELARVVERGGFGVMTSLMLVDLSAQLRDAPAYRSGGSCPETDEHEAGGVVELSMDYGGGCIPDSGIVSTVVEGSGSLVYDEPTVAVQVDAMGTGGAWLDGHAEGSWAELAGSDVEITLDAELVATGEVEAEIDQVVVATLLADGSTLAGDVELLYEGESVAVALSLDDVHLAYNPRVDPCPLPQSGEIGVWLDGEETRLSFTPEASAEGEATVVHQGSVNENVPLCDYAGFYGD